MKSAAWVLITTPSVLGVAIGYARGGRLSSIRLRSLWLLWAAAMVQLAQYRAVGLRDLIQNHLGISLLIPIFILVAVFLWRNMAPHGRMPRPAMAGIAAGMAGNAVAIAANHGRMPWWPAAARVAGMVPAATGSPKNQPAVSGTRLPWLGDVIPLPGFHMVMSLGDVAIIAGAAIGVAALMTKPTTSGVPDDDHGRQAGRSRRQYPRPADPALSPGPE